jgi:hypothetical protein
MRRKELRLGVWNVTGCRNRECELEDALKGYKLDVLGLSETWLRKGEEIAIPGYNWVGVAGEKASGKGGGIGFLVKDTVWELVGQVIEVNSRIMGIFMKLGKTNCWILQVYAPINDACSEERERFWRCLRDEVEERRKSASVIVMGDLNGRVGKQPEDWDIVGQYGEEEINQNGESCLELCRGSGMVVMNGWFPHKKVHKMTYVQRMADQHDREAILDYFCVSRELKPSVVDVKVKRGAEIGSFHHLVMMRLDRGKLGQTPKKWRRTKWRWCLGKLKNEEGKTAYQEKLKEKLGTGEYKTVEEEWSAFKSCILDAAEESIGKKKCTYRGKRWWNKEIEQLVKLKKEAYRQWLHSRAESDKKVFRELCTRVKRTVEEAKMRAWEEFGKELQTDFWNNSQMFWRKIRNRTNQTRVMLKNEKGEVIQEDEKLAEWCKKYFESLYNEGYTESGGTENEMNGEENTEEEEAPTREEVRKSIERLKNGKAAGYSGIVGEMVKEGKDLLEGPLHRLFQRVWKEEKVPKDWESGIVIPLYKKGDQMNLDNYRGITLMDVIGKVFSGILRHRLEKCYMGKIVEEQAGFRRGRGCVDQGYTLAQIILKRLEMQKVTYLCFVDLKKAYDSVWREGLFKKLRQDGVPRKLVKLVRMWYSNVRALVRVNDVESGWFDTKVGVRQGDTLSPLLFNIFINGIVEKVREGGGGVRVGEMEVPILLFADDMVLMADGVEELERLVRKVKEYCESWHLEVNVGKTKVMVVSKDGTEVAQVRYGQEELECVSKYPYLGTLFTADGRWEMEVERRRQAGRAALCSLNRQVVWNKSVSLEVKRCVFEAMVKSRLLYGGDIWWASKKDSGKLETVQNDFIRWVSGYTRKDKMSAGKLRKEVAMVSVEDSLCRRRLEWLGKLIRMDGNRLVSRVWGAECEGKRARGRPRQTYAKLEAEDLARAGASRIMALEKAKWRAAVRQIGEPC